MEVDEKRGLTFYCEITRWNPNTIVFQKCSLYSLYHGPSNRMITQSKRNHTKQIHKIPFRMITQCRQHYTNQNRKIQKARGPTPCAIETNCHINQRQSTHLQPSRRGQCSFGAVFARACPKEAIFHVVTPDSIGSLLCRQVRRKQILEFRLLHALKNVLLGDAQAAQRFLDLLNTGVGFSFRACDTEFESDWESWSRICFHIQNSFLPAAAVGKSNALRRRSGSNED